jgi:hypothetical protein
MPTAGKEKALVQEVKGIVARPEVVAIINGPPKCMPPDLVPDIVERGHPQDDAGECGRRGEGGSVQPGSAASPAVWCVSVTVLHCTHNCVV